MSRWKWCTGSFAGMVGCVCCETPSGFFLWWRRMQCHLACPLGCPSMREEGHWDYSWTAQSSRVQSSILINCEWGQTDTHYLSLGNALWLQKGAPLHWCKTSFLNPNSAAVYTEKQIGVESVFIHKLLGHFMKYWPVTNWIKCGIEVERLLCCIALQKNHYYSAFATLYFLKILISKDLQNVRYTCFTAWQVGRSYNSCTVYCDGFAVLCKECRKRKMAVFWLVYFLLICPKAWDLDG